MSHRRGRWAPQVLLSLSVMTILVLATVAASVSPAFADTAPTVSTIACDPAVITTLEGFECTVTVSPATATGTVSFETISGGSLTFYHSCSLFMGACSDTFDYTGDVGGGYSVRVNATYLGDANDSPSSTGFFYVKIDLSQCQPIGATSAPEVCLPQVTGQSFQVAYDGGHYGWVAVGIPSLGGYPGDGGLFRVDLNQVINSTETSVTSFGQPFPFSSPSIGNLAGGPFGVIVVDGIVYSTATYNEGDAFAATDPATNTTEVYYSPDSSVASNLLSNDGRYVYRGGSGEVIVFDTVSRVFSNLDVAPCDPTWVNPQGERLWLTCGAPHGLAVVNKNGTGLQVFDYGYSGVLSYVDVNGSVWFTSNDGHSLSECASPCTNETRIIPYTTGQIGDGPYGVTYDPARKGLWVANYRNLDVLFFDFASKSFDSNSTLFVSKAPYMGFVDHDGNVWNLALGSTDILYISPTMKFDGRSATTTAIDCTPDMVYIGYRTQCTATVSGDNPSGLVFWSEKGSGGSTFGSAYCNVSWFSCSVILTGTVEGTLDLTATYHGDSANRASSGGKSLNVTSKPEQVTVSCPTSALAVGILAICRVVVVGALPTGLVRWSSSGLGRFTAATCRLSGGKCSVRFAALVGGTQNVTASYLGDYRNAPMSSGTGVNAVNKLKRAIVSPFPSQTGDFGAVVSTATSFVFVGSPFESQGGLNQTGSVSSYRSGTGALLRTFSDPSPEAGGEFGAALAQTGLYVAIGAPNDTVDGLQGAGKVYVFNKITGALFLTMTSPSPAAGGRFGNSLAWSPRLAVGAVGEGKVYIFGPSGVLQRTLTDPAGGASGSFGYSLDEVGPTLVVGAPTENVTGHAGAGSAYVFIVATGALRLTATSPSPQSEGGFGHSVTIIGLTVAVGAFNETTKGIAGAGAVYEFNWRTGLLTKTVQNPAPSRGAAFGSSVLIRGGNLYVSSVGSPSRVPGSGAVYVFLPGSAAFVRAYVSPTPAVGGGYGAGFGGAPGIGIAAGPTLCIGEAAASAYLGGGILREY